MGDAQTGRRLAAILAADVVGYSRLMASDESATLAALKAHRETVFNPAVAQHGGRVVKLIGDGTLVEFTSVVDAVNCAVAIQQVLAAEPEADGPSMVLRIGINLGDVIIDGDDVYGDGVNIAARLEPLARPGGICVSSIVRESVRDRANATFVDGSEAHVKNIDRPISVWHWHPDNGAAPAGPKPPSSFQQPDEAQVEATSIAVLPFANMSGDDEQEYFSDGISEDIITDLSKVSGLLVIARNSSFAYKGRAVDLRQVGRELGVTTVLEGSVRRAGNRVRITAQLIDAETGGHLWAERYDRDLTDIFAVQDEVTLSIVDALKVTLSPGEEARIADVGTTNLEAHDNYLRGLQLTLSPNLNAEVLRRARECSQRAVELDPKYSRPYAVLAAACVFDAINHWSDDSETSLARGAEFAARAIELDPNDASAHHADGLVAMWSKDLVRAAEAYARSLALNPNYVYSVFNYGCVEMFAGRPAGAIPQIERALRLDPAFGQQYLHFLGMSHLLLGNDETAAVYFRERIVLAPGTDSGRAMLCSALGHLGQIDEARKVWQDLRRRHPDYAFEERLAQMPFADGVETDRIVQGLAKAGLPD